MIFLLDMVAIFITATKDGRRLVMEHKEIALTYLKGWFLFDLAGMYMSHVCFVVSLCFCCPTHAASVPLDLILWLGSGASFNNSPGASASRSTKLIRVIKIFRIFRILRLLRLKRIVITLEIFLGLNFSAMAIAKYTVLIFLLAHLLACGFLYAGADGDGWMQESKADQLDQGGKYVAALYWAFTTMTTIGYGDVAARSTAERTFSTFCMILGGVTFTYSVTRIVHIAASLGKSEKNLAEKLESVNDWAGYHEFPEGLVADIKTYMHYKSSRSYFDEKAVISGLSVSLKRKVLKYMFENALKRVDLFRDSSAEFLTELMVRMQSEFASPFSLIISENSVGDSMYIVRRGFCAVYKGVERSDVESAIIMGPGQAFGEIALLADNITRTANVVALEWTDLAKITRACFEELLTMFPTERFKMHKYAQSKLDQFNKRKRNKTKIMINRLSAHPHHQEDSKEDSSADEDEEKREMIANFQQDHDATRSFIKNELKQSQIEELKTLETQYASDETLNTIDALYKQIQKLKLQWLMHLNAEIKNKRYMERVFGRPGGDRFEVLRQREEPKKVLK